MAFVVTEACIACKYTDCVSVCPMECFYEGPNFLVINPDECIDCSICVGECPVEAIVGEREIAPDQAHFVQMNRDLSQDPRWKRIAVSRSPLPEHAAWAKVKDKIHLLAQPEAAD
ncbi:ferredoxin FdxA [Noviherbaspirillum massiliense]|uniref:ferredoxin FdxA n=1 Tax=Noviherbaspirillum massiliense TaxID=1465823 RepID=UPI00054EBBB7|nr:ferredoxin FdxA [Noviherbaspirillum massiliense]